MTTLEISVVSTEGLDKYYSYFITLANLPAHAVYHCDGGGRGTRNHMFRVPLDPTFFSDTYSWCLRLQLYTKRRIVGSTLLGWCLISPSDIASPLLPPHSLRYLSYRLRAADGSRGHIIINLSVKLQASFLDTCQSVIGMPVTAVRGIANGYCNLQQHQHQHEKSHGHSKIER